MNSTLGRDRCIARWCTQKPTSAFGSGMYWDFSPRFIGRHVLPASSVRNTPAAEMAMKIRSGWLGSSRIVCKPMPPAPGAHLGPCWSRSPGISCQVRPPSRRTRLSAYPPEPVLRSSLPPSRWLNLDDLQLHHPLRAALGPLGKLQVFRPQTQPMFALVVKVHFRRHAGFFAGFVEHDT